MGHKVEVYCGFSVNTVEKITQATSVLPFLGTPEVPGNNPAEEEVMLVGGRL